MEEEQEKLVNAMQRLKGNLDFQCFCDEYIRMNCSVPLVGLISQNDVLRRSALEKVQSGEHFKSFLVYLNNIGEAGDGH